ncbi:hypothetical protein HYH03_006528 [Edaphochlamys debaryana]|uniref:Uncharacterized protein n=1 Tax=Edaphochlamys debaryana TaxID=47281 RepID=A0A835Y3D8_9CHLO|nr:hypothetical protein HYH03_006528 [Edaphochlamys debaryana]|eukprot:KAG2495255.1 hypothetical protein HYH03_006528 [Edaphochlamys debaryana]
MAAAPDLEEQKKLILPFMQRAQEIQQADPRVAYFCRMYAVEQAMQLTHRAKEVNALLAATLSQLEKDKAKLDPPPGVDPAADRIHCLGFALRVFDNADRVDRAGKATERTSKAFYAASVFIEILNQFDGGVDQELFEKQRYCAWRAADIRKALREGRQPTPPPSNVKTAPGGPSGGGGVDDLPPASGNSDWAYGPSAPAGSSTAAAGSSAGSRAAPGPGSGDFSISAGSGSGSGYGSIGGASTAPPPPPPPAGSDGFPDLPSVPSFGGPSFSGGSYLGLGPSAPQPPHPPPPPAAAFGGAGGGGGSGAGPRFHPGSRLLVRLEASQETQTGTVGQVLTRPDGGFSYKVALRNRLVDVHEEEAVPALAEGDPVLLRGRRPGAGALGGGPAPPLAGTVVLINDASWPPSYLVKTSEGAEVAAEASELASPLPASAPSAPSAPLPPPPAARPYSQPSPPRAPPPPAVPPPPPPPAHGAAGAPGYPSVGSGHFGMGMGAPPPQQPPAPPAAPSGYGWGAQLAAQPTPPPQQQPQQQPMPTFTVPPGNKPSLQVITDAQKQAKYAVSALSFEDTVTAVKHLTEAIRLLTQPQAAQQAQHGQHGQPGGRR